MKPVKKILAFLVASVIITSLFCGIDFSANAASVSLLLDTKKTLEPGTFDDLSTDDYNIRFIRSEAGYPGFDDVDDYFQVRENSITAPDSYGYSETFGSMLKNPHKKAYFAVDKAHSGAGASFIYKVVGGTYVATALLFQGSDISQASRTEICNAYGFDYSVDGNKWISIVPDFTYEHGWTPQNPGPGHQISCVRAVVLLPENACYYRITLPGFDKSKATDNSTDADLHGPYSVPAQNDTYVGLNQVCGIGASCASELDLNEVNEWMDIPTESNKAEYEEFNSVMSSKNVLAPGVRDDLSDDSYAYKMVRSKTLPSVGVALEEKDYLKEITAPPYDPNGGSTMSRMTMPLGQLFGIRAERVLTNYSQNSAWSGNAIVYKVLEGTYIATMLAVPPGYNDNGMLPYHYSNFGFEVSVNGLYWQSITPTYSNAGNWTQGKHQLSFIQATVKIPGGMNYYRITLPGYNKSQTGTSLRVENSWVANTGVSAIDCGTSNVSIGAIGMSMASGYDLSKYTDINDIPPETIDKSQLEKLLQRVAVAKEKDIVEGRAKDRFVSALEDAQSVYDNADASQVEINKSVSALEKAFIALQYNDFDDAVLSGTDKQYIARRFLRPGIYDEMLCSPLENEDGTAIVSDGFTIYRSDYSDPFILSYLDGVNNTAYTRMVLDRSNTKFSSVSFMGKPILGAYGALSSWSGSGITYRVYGNSYVSTALLINKEQTAHGLGDLTYKFSYMVSQDGKNYYTVSPESIVKVDSCDKTSDGSAPYGWDVYKVTVKIPDKHTYYRIIIPGALELSENTGYYAPNPSFYDAMIGPSIASKYDLQEYDSYADVPDYCAVYADPEISDSNEKIAVISEKTVGIMKYNLKVSDVKNAITVNNGKSIIKHADGSIAKDTDNIVSGMTLTLYDNSDNDYFANIMREPLMLVMYDDLYAVQELEPITVANGSEKSVEGLTLPQKIMIYTGSETLDADVEWDINGCNYNPKVTQLQSFTVNGKVNLPNGVKNTMKLSLTVSADVIVSQPYSPSVRVREGVTKVKVDRGSLVIYYTRGMTAEELLSCIEPYGDTEYSITKYDSSTDEVLSVNNTDKLDTLMGLDVRYINTDYSLGYFIFEEMDAAVIDSIGENVPGSSENVPGTGDSRPINIYFCLLMVSFCFTVVGAVKIKNAKKS